MFLLSGKHLTITGLLWAAVCLYDPLILTQLHNTTFELHYKADTT